MPAEQQPYSSFRAINVAAGKTTDLKLSGGRNIPYVYSLGVNSTIPYVRLIGSSAGQKLFSWNEKIVVPPGEMVTVANASFHPGDIFIQSGWDPGARPARVTVPVSPILDVANSRLTPAFNVDTRRARRAYVSGMPSRGVNTQVDVVGISKERSHAITTLSYGQVARFTYTFFVPPLTEFGLIPLGDQSQPGDTVHDLLDEATFTIYTNSFENQSGALHYVLEYV